MKDSTMEEIKNIITRKIVFLNIDNELGLYDENKHAEDFFLPILNIVLDLNLVNLNEISKNFPCIDLYDENKNIGVQVTSTVRNEKIKNMMDCIERHNPKPEMKRIIVFITDFEKEVSSSKKEQFINDSGLEFNFKDDRWNLNKLISAIEKLDVVKKQEILSYLKYDKKNDISYIFIDQETKNEEFGYDFIERNLVRELDNYSVKDLKSEIDTQKRILIVGEAGSGKSELCKYIKNIYNTTNNVRVHINRMKTFGSKVVNETDFVDAPDSSIVFVFDGLDEMAMKDKMKFLQRIDEYIERNPNVRIIITSRPMNYENYKLLTDHFQRYYLELFSESQVNEALENKGLNTARFKKFIIEKNLGDIIRNPFYLNHISEEMDTDNIIEGIINKSVDEDKFKQEYNSNFNRKSYLKTLRVIAFSMKISQKRMISYDKVDEISESGNDYLNCSSIMKYEDGFWIFNHEKYPDYLLSELLNSISVEKSISFFEDESPDFIEWLEVFVILFDSDNTKLKQRLVPLYPEIVLFSNLEFLEKKDRQKILIELIEIYDRKRVWIPLIYNNVQYNVQNILDFTTINKLVSYLKTDSHFTTVGNVISILNRSNKKELTNFKNVLEEVVLVEEFRMREELLLVRLLADFDMLDMNFFKKVIDKNINIENSQTRSSYFYCLSKLKIDFNDLDIVIDRLPMVYNFNSDETVFVDEEINLIEFFKSLNEIDLVEKVVTTLLEETSIYHYHILTKLSEILMRNFSFEKSNYLLFSIYKKFVGSNSNREIELFVEALEQSGLFKSFLTYVFKFSNTDDVPLFLVPLLNVESVIYLTQQYSRFEITDENIFKILRRADKTIKGIDGLEEIYISRTNTSDYAYTKYHPICIESTRQDYFELLLDQKSFCEKVTSVYEELKIDFFSNSTREKYRQTNLDNDYVKRKIVFFGDRFAGEHGEINVDMFIENFNFSVVLSEITEIVEVDENIYICETNRNTIHEMCKKVLSNDEYINLEKNEYNGSCRIISLDLLCVWKLKIALDVEMPDNTQLDMLNFNWIFRGEFQGIDHVKKHVDVEQIKERIVLNIKEDRVFPICMNNHYLFIIENRIMDLSDDLLKKLQTNEELTQDVVENIIDYLVIDYDKNDLIEMVFLDNLSDQVKTRILRRITLGNACEIIQALKDKLEKIEEGILKNEIIRVLITNSEVIGLLEFKKIYFETEERLFKWEEVLNAISNIDTLFWLDEVLIFYSELNEKSNDEDTYLRIALENAIQNISVNHKKEVLDKLREIDEKKIGTCHFGYENYLIDKIKHQSTLTEEEMTEKIVEIVNDLLSTKKIQGF